MTQEAPEHVTVLAEEFTAAALEFHRAEMGRRGYTLTGPIVRHEVYTVADPGAPPTPMNDPKSYFVATFKKKAA